MNFPNCNVVVGGSGGFSFHIQFLLARFVNIFAIHDMKTAGKKQTIAKGKLQEKQKGKVTLTLNWQWLMRALKWKCLMVLCPYQFHCCPPLTPAHCLV